MSKGKAMDGSGELRDAIQGLIDPMVIMRRVVDQALVLITSAEGAVVELVHEGNLTYVCAAGALAAYVGTRLRLADSLSGLSVQTGETLYCQDSASDRRVDRAACRAVGAISMVCVPLRLGDEPVGALKVSAGRPCAFTAEDVAKLSSLAEFIGVAIGSVTEIHRITGRFSTAEDPDPGESVWSREEAPSSRGTDLDEFVVNVLRPGMAAALAARRRIERVIESQSVTMHCQPIVSLASGRLFGLEALARFPAPPRQAPDVWFAEAETAGLGVELQLTAAAEALSLTSQLPDGVFLAVNVGPDVISDPRLSALLQSAPGERIVLELTEHLSFENYPTLRRRLQDIRAVGVRLAIDDTGAGYASLGNIVNLAPDLIKLDRQFTRGIDLDPVRRALAGALVSFAADTGAEVIAEGIENADELATVRELGIRYGQGYFIARPAPLAALPRELPHLHQHLVRLS